MASDNGAAVVDPGPRQCSASQHPSLPGRPAWLLQVLRGIGNMDGSDDAEFSLIQGFHLAVVSQSRLNKL